MAMKFKYKTLKRDARTLPVKEPSINVRLLGPKGPVFIVGLLDTGSDLCAIPKSLAEILGLKITGEKQPISGLGQAEGAESSMEIEVSHGRESHRLAVPVMIIYSPEGAVEPPVILGRSGFLDAFEITFNERQSRITMKWLPPAR